MVKVRPGVQAAEQPPSGLRHSAARQIGRVGIHCQLASLILPQQAAVLPVCFFQKFHCSCRNGSTQHTLRFYRIAKRHFQVNKQRRCPPLQQCLPLQPCPLTQALQWNLLRQPLRAVADKCPVGYQYPLLCHAVFFHSGKPLFSLTNLF